jgi:hypothetical protein
MPLLLQTARTTELMYVGCVTMLDERTQSSDGLQGAKSMLEEVRR